MIALTIVVLSLACLVTPVSANQADEFDPDRPFEQALTHNLLRSLLNEALDQLEDHVEISGNLNPDDTKDDRGTHLRLKFYPEGKSKSDEHFSAEGWFRSSSESGQRDWQFKFQRPEDPPKKSPPQFEAPL